jgi:hypothetical protein
MSVSKAVFMGGGMQRINDILACLQIRTTVVFSGGSQMILCICYTFRDRQKPSISTSTAVRCNLLGTLTSSMIWSVCVRFLE